eukprot:364989-Chlamydomonas_euryale.AAC.11
MRKASAVLAACVLRSPPPLPTKPSTTLRNHSPPVAKHSIHARRSVLQRAARLALQGDDGLPESLTPTHCTAEQAQRTEPG